MKSYLTKISSLIAALLAPMASADIILNQAQPSGPTYMAGFGQIDLAQSFQQSVGNVAGAGILLQRGVGTTDSVTISLWDALPHSAGATQLASASAIGTAGFWVDVFWNPVAVTPYSTLYLDFSTAGNTLGIAGDLDDPYAAGMVFANAGYNAFPDFDYAFHTFAYARLPGSEDIPLPGILSLLGIGVAALLASKRYA